MRTRAFLAVLAFAAGGTAFAQTPLFLSLEPSDPGGSPPPTVHGYYDIEIDFEALKHAPEQLQVALPGGGSFIAQKNEFLYRAGYAQRQEWDPPDTPPIYPIPGLPDDWFSYRWAGGNDQYDVTITVIEGRMSAMINGSNRYRIRKEPSGHHRLAHLRTSAFRGCGVGQERQEAIALGEPQPPFEFDMIREHVDQPLSLHEPERGGSVVRVDMLIPWTEEARIQAGGSPSDPNDTVHLYDLIQTVVDDSQTAFQNSLTSVRVTRYVTARLTGFTLTGNSIADLDTLRDNPAMATLRNTTGTDMVVAMVYGSLADLPVCGVANVQTYPGCGSPSPGCGPGALFDAFAYSLVASDCARDDFTFTHEIGHLMGGNHTRGQLAPSWVNGVVANGYPDAFAKMV